MELVKPEFHEKGWGSELWLANNEVYCVKQMIINPGKKCSIHYHKIKEERFVVMKGSLRLLLFPNIGIKSFEHLATVMEPSKLEKGLLRYAEELILKPGDSHHLHNMLPHQFYGLGEEPTIFIEISTTHKEEDSYRIVKGD